MSRSSSDSESSVRLPAFSTNRQEGRKSRSPISSIRASSRSRSRQKRLGPSVASDDYFSALNTSSGPGFHSPPILEDDDEARDILADQPALPSFGKASISSTPFDQSSRRKAIEEEMDADARDVFQHDFGRIESDTEDLVPFDNTAMGTGDFTEDSDIEIQSNESRLQNRELESVESPIVGTPNESILQNREQELDESPFAGSSNEENIEKVRELENDRETEINTNNNKQALGQGNKPQGVKPVREVPRVKFHNSSEDGTTEDENDEINKLGSKVEGNLEEGSSGTVTNESNEDRGPMESFKDRFKRKMSAVFTEDDDIPIVPGDENIFNKLMNFGDIGGLAPGASKFTNEREPDEEEEIGFGNDSIPLNDLTPDILHQEAKGLIKDHEFYQNRNDTGSTFNFYIENPDYNFAADSDEYEEDALDGRDSIVKAPKRYQAGVLSSLLKLYANPAASASSQTLTRSDDESILSGMSSPFPNKMELNPKELKNKLKKIGSHLRSPSQSNLFGSDDETFHGSSKTNFDKKKSTPSISGLLHPHGNSKGTKKLQDGEIDSMPTFHSTRPKVNRKKKLMKSKREATKAKITVHIADILQKQRFILRICKALMLYGAPTHRLEEYMAMTARVLEIDGQFIYFPGVMLVSFGDSSTRTSEVQVVRCAQGLDLSKLNDTHKVYKAVVHDIMGVEEASAKIDELLSKKPIYPPWFCVFLYGFGSAMVTSWGFRGGWKDLPISFGIGLCVGFLQFYVSPRSSMYSNVFEVTSSIVVSFLGRALGSINNGKTFCFGGIVQGSLSLILPGYIILCGSLELQSRNLVAGSVRMFYAIIYSLFLGFGITLGAALYGWIDHNATSDTTCPDSIQLSPWFRFLFVPGFAVTLGLINQARVSQLPAMVVIAGLGYVVTYFAGKHFSTSTEFTASMGAFVIGILGNLYSRVGRGMAVSAMLPAIFVQVPSGIASKSSLLSGVQTADTIVNNSTASSSSGDSLSFGVTMVEVAIGISVGLYAAAIVVYPLGKKSTGLFTL